MNLQTAVKRVLKRYPSLRAAGLDLDIDHVYLWRMLQGKKKNPSLAVLKKLGIKLVKEREAVYE